MFRITQIILLTIVFLNSGFNRYNNEILRKTISKLNSLESIEYDYTNHWHYSSKNVDIIESRNCFYDFKIDEDSVGLRYYIQDEYGEYIFNGDTLIEVSESAEMILYSFDFTKEFVLNVQGMSNSLFALKKFLPMIIDNPSVNISQQKDTIINEGEYYKFHIKFEGSFDLGGFGLGRISSKIEQILIINKQNYLPHSYRTIYPKHVADRKSFV